MARFRGVDETVIAGMPSARRPEELGGLADYWVTHEDRSDSPGAMHVVVRVTTDTPDRADVRFVTGGVRGAARSGV